MNGSAPLAPMNAHHRYSADFTPNPEHPPRLPADEYAAAPMPVAGAPRPFAGMSRDAPGFGQMGPPRSPPKNKNTQHVPCKFFLQGQCQAGRMCPFSHDVESSTRPAPCKYFAKGGCKFGRKCALLHITQDGTVVNQGPRYGAGPAFAQPPPPPPTFGQPHHPGLLSMQAQGLDPRRTLESAPEHDGYQQPPQIPTDYPHIDFAYTSASPPYGSPLHENYFAHSPPAKGLSVLDAPLPSSFDSNGISHAARNGPFAASVPSRFGLESPPASLPRKSQLGNTALRDLHSSAFGDRGMDGVLAGSSPPSGSDEPLTFSKRPLHSERLYAPRHQIISASLGTRLPAQSFEYSDDEDGDVDREEGLLPASLRELIPESRTRAPRPRVEEGSSPAAFLAAQRRTLSGHGTPQDSKVGSPHSSSPSRFSSIFNRSQGSRTEEGHVGSPLRNTGLTLSGDLSPTFGGSPPQQSSMSALTQELRRTRLDAVRSQTSAAAGGVGRTLSNGSTPRASLDRAVSGNGVGRERIEEEQELFDMDELGGPSRSAPRNIPKNSGDRNGGTWNADRPSGLSPGHGGSSFGAIGAHRPAK